MKAGKRMRTVEVQYHPYAKQRLFHACGADECVYGGAKGGGKSYSLVAECGAYCLEYPGATAYLFRERYDDLEANIISVFHRIMPPMIYTYDASKYVATLYNGSKVYFRYIRNVADADKYQGRSMDWIGIDELTKHLFKAVQILLSCLRSPKGFPPRFRATCNPGGVGHVWVKKRYITGTDYGRRQYVDPETGNTIAFIPASVYDNDAIMHNDPKYVRRLENLPEAEKKAFLYGDWDIFQGQYFDEFSRKIHVVEPFKIPDEWRRYRVFDYGLDRLACLWVAVDSHGWAYVYRELCQSRLIASDAARRILQSTATDEQIFQTIAPPDIWGRQSTTGMSSAEYMRREGLILIKGNNDRVSGWMSLKEWLKPMPDEHGRMAARLRIFRGCSELIECLQTVQHDDHDVNDVATEPHEITHAPDALRYFVAGRPMPAETTVKRIPKESQFSFEQDEGNGYMNW